MDAEARDGFEFVEGAAGVPEAAAGHHGDIDAARRDERGEDQRRFVADAAGGVFVDLGAGEIGEVELFARGDHSPRQFGGFVRVHALEDDGHEKGGRLIVGPGAIGDAADEGADFVGGESAAVAFFPENIDRAHDRIHERAGDNHVPRVQNDEIGPGKQGEL